MTDKPFHESEPYRPLDRFFPFIAWDTFKTPFWFPLHWHERVEILSVLKGGCRVSINGREGYAREGDIVMVNMGLVHGFFQPQDDTLVRIFQFGLEIFDETLREIQGEGSRGLVFSRRPFITAETDLVVHARLHEILARIFTEYREQGPGFRLAIKAKLFDMAVILLRELPETPEPAGKAARRNVTQHLERIFACMIEHSGDPDFGLEDAAAGAGLSRFHLSRLIKSETGEGFREHLARLRVRQAEKDLVGSDLPVTEIAYRSGFRSLATFNRVFKEYAGECPSGYRGGRAQSGNKPATNE